MGLATQGHIAPKRQVKTGTTSAGLQTPGDLCPISPKMGGIVEDATSSIRPGLSPQHQLLTHAQVAFVSFAAGPRGVMHITGGHTGSGWSPGLWLHLLHPFLLSEAQGPGHKQGRAPLASVMLRRLALGWMLSGSQAPLPRPISTSETKAFVQPSPLQNSPLQWLHSWLFSGPLRARMQRTHLLP